ncbi:hypothetical protein KM043_007809 [Ampulex compressa]|nr:hypothetical protein KM043_007809 [Ampulex compressa]
MRLRKEACALVRVLSVSSTGREEEEEEEEGGGGCVICVAREIENGRKSADSGQNKGKPPNETEIRISKRGIGAWYIVYAGVQLFDVGYNPGNIWDAEPPALAFVIA